MRITVVGLGKIGLPLAVQFARSGQEVIGADVSPTVVELVNAGTEPFPGEAHLQEYLAEAVAAGTLTATTDTADAVSKSDAVVVVVPLFVDAEARHQIHGSLNAPLKFRTAPANSFSDSQRTLAIHQEVVVHNPDQLQPILLD